MGGDWALEALGGEDGIGIRGFGGGGLDGGGGGGECCWSGGRGGMLAEL